MLRGEKEGRREEREKEKKGNVAGANILSPREREKQMMIREERERSV